MRQNPPVWARLLGVRIRLSIDEEPTSAFNRIIHLHRLNKFQTVLTSDYQTKLRVGHDKLLSVFQLANFFPVYRHFVENCPLEFLYQIKICPGQ